MNKSITRSGSSLFVIRLAASLKLASRAAAAYECLRRLRPRGRRARTTLRRAAGAVVVAAALLLGMGKPVIAAVAPTFTGPSTNPFGLAKVGNSSAPTFVDIDGDGDLDAFVGNFDGNAVFFRNTGSAIAPAFAAPSANPFGLADAGYEASPTFVDIDGDGDLDAFVGNYDGNTLFFRNTGSASAPAFAAPSANPFGLAKMGASAIPTFVDIDSDGDVDAFVGDYSGATFFFRNTGSAIAPAFAASSANPFGLASGGYNVAPKFADLDEDGDLDALVGINDGNLIFLRNTGSATAPAFAAPITTPFGLADAGGYATPTFADIDGDGDLDVFVGNNAGNTLFFRNTTVDLWGNFSGPIVNPFGLADVGLYSAPTFADIDGDGDLDAFVGEYLGRTLFFRNTGSATAPAFAAPSANPFGLRSLLGLNTPNFVDIDSDGDLDVFEGNYSGNTFFQLNTGNATAPAFDPLALSMNPFGLADVGFDAAPSFADIDSDGDLDAFVGERFGSTIFFRNTGSATAPAFAAPSSNPFGLADVGTWAAPTFVDVDGDGDLDAFVGNYDGNTIFFLNTGSAKAPAFAAPITNPFGLANVGRLAKPTFANIDGDGDLDVFVGNYDGNAAFFLNKPLKKMYFPNTQRSAVAGW